MINEPEHDQSAQQIMEHRAAIWWRFYSREEKPFFLPEPPEPRELAAKKNWISEFWLGETAAKLGDFCEAEWHFRKAVNEAIKIGDQAQTALSMKLLEQSVQEERSDDPTRQLSSQQKEHDRLSPYKDGM